MNKKSKKGAPLLLLILLAIGALAVGATLINLWQSQIIPDVYEVTTDFRGVDAQLIQAGGFILYTTPADSTTLAGQLHGHLDASTFATNCAILIIHTYDLPNKDLTMTIDVFETGTTTPYDGWTCTATFVEFWSDGDGHIALDSTLTVGRGPWVIQNGKIADMVHDPTVLPVSPQVDDYNALILSFDFTGASTLLEYGEDWVSQTDYTTTYDLKVTLAVEDV